MLGLAGFQALLGHFVVALKADGKKSKEAAVANLRAILKKVQCGASRRYRRCSEPCGPVHLFCFHLKQRARSFCFVPQLFRGEVCVVSGSKKTSNKCVWETWLNAAIHTSLLERQFDRAIVEQPVWLCSGSLRWRRRWTTRSKAPCGFSRSTSAEDNCQERGCVFVFSSVIFSSLLDLWRGRPLGGDVVF